MVGKKTIPAIEDFIGHAVRVRTNSYIDHHGLTKFHLAKQARIAPATINRITNCDVMPSLRSVIMLSLVMGVSVDWLCGLDLIRERISNGQNAR